MDKFYLDKEAKRLKGVDYGDANKLAGQMIDAIMKCVDISERSKSQSRRAGT